MTVIAWDGQTLAADRRTVFQGLVRTTRKIFRLDQNQMIAVCGEASIGRQMVQWLRDGADPEKFPELQKEEKRFAPVAVIIRDGVDLYECTPRPTRLFDYHFAMGSGRDFALMAMHLGKNAKEAVELTCLFQSDCGNGVDTMEFE